MTLLDYMVAAIVFGIRDSVNPYMLSMVLCFLAFLAFIGNTPKQIVLVGRFMIATAFGLVFFLAWGTNALWLEHPVVIHSIRFLSLGAAVVLLTVGYLLLEHWRQGKRPASTQWLPRFLADEISLPAKNTGIIFFSVILGLVTVLFVSLWPKDQNFYIVYYLLFTSGNVSLATFFFVLYSLAFALPLLIVWAIVFYIKSSAKLRNDFLRAISWLRICFSAIFIAVGMGLIYLFIAA